MKSDIIDTLASNIRYKYLDVSKDEEIDYEKNKRNVIEEIKYHIGENSISDLMLDQLIQIHGRNYVLIYEKRHPYHLNEIYWRMESIVKEEISYKEFLNKESKLYGRKVLHVHHSQSFYIEDNQIRYIKWKYKEPQSLEDRVKEIATEGLTNNPILEFVNETLIKSMDWNMKTGEWILFQHKDSEFHFIGLALHNSDDINDEMLEKVIGKYIKEDF